MIDKVIKIRPKHYVHVLDTNKGITRLEIGSKTITLEDHEELVLEETPMILIPPRHYCVIKNPVYRKDGEIILDKDGQVKLRDGDEEIRFEQDPFALYPGEELQDDIEELDTIAPDTALNLTAIRSFDDETNKENIIHREAGDEWLFRGPGTYIPRVEVEVGDTIYAIIIEPNKALRLEAFRECTDCYGKKRKAGENWLIKEEGAYIPDVNEKVIGKIDAVTLTEEIALSLEATKTFKDIYGIERKAGDKWLVTYNMAETHIVDIYERVIEKVQKTTIKEGYWAKILNPVDENFKPQLGKEEIRKGLISFFLHPGEEIEKGIQKVFVLAKNESLLLTAVRTFTDGEDEKQITRQPGDKWMIVGPTDYIPTINVDLSKIEKRNAIPLDDNEGKYVQNTLTGKVRLIKGETYMLEPDEELWEKDLPPVVEKLLNMGPIVDRGMYFGENNQDNDDEDAGYNDYTSLRKMVPTRRMSRQIKETSPITRDKTNAVTFRVPPNAISQIYNFKTRTPRFVVGPDLVMLEPDEDFTILSLSGDKPKVPNKIKSLALMLGPDFMTDYVDVETSDHAQLQLRLAYNWQFKSGENTEESYKKMFSVPDFVGDACKTIASRVRAVVAMTAFDDFHKNSAKLIRSAVFGTDDQGHVKDEFEFKTNSLVITNIDIQGVEPKDQDTRNNLQKSVKLAIKITTDAQEAAAKRNAEKIEQQSKSELQLEHLKDEQQIEIQNKALYEQQAENEAVKTTGLAVAEAKAKAQADQIKGKAEIESANNKAEAARITALATLETQKAIQEAELAHQTKLAELEVSKKRDLETIEIEAFQKRIAAITPEVLKEIAKAGPEMQVKLLQGLGIKSMLITDGKSPLNLFSTAKGLITNNIEDSDIK